MDIEEIDFTNCTALTDAILNNILIKCAKLKHIEIKNCTSVTREAFANIDISTWISLDISGCYSLSDTDLKLMFNDMQSLKNLTLENRHDLSEDVFTEASFSQLIHISLRDCISLTDNCLAKLFLASLQPDDFSTSIKSINLRNCRLITGAGFLSEDFDISNLTCLILQDCVSLSKENYENIVANIASQHAILTSGCDNLPSSLIGDIVTAGLTYFGVSFTFDYYIRWQYIAKDEEIARIGRELVDSARENFPADSELFSQEYDIGANCIIQRNQAKADARRIGDAVDKTWMDTRNQEIYNDELGPSPEAFLASKKEYINGRLAGKEKVDGKKSVDKIIESSGKTDKATNEVVKNGLCLEYYIWG